MQPVQSVAELCEVLPDMESRLVRAPNHITKVLPAQRRADDVMRHVEGMFLPESNIAVLRSDIIARIDQFLKGGSHSARVDLEDKDKWMLAMVKGDLALAAHQVAHGFGSGNDALRFAETEGYWREPRDMVFNEGFCELISRRYLNQLIQMLGLDVIDPRILDIPPIRQRFVAPYEIVNGMISHVASTHGIQVDDVITRVALAGASEYALWSLASGWSRADRQLGSVVVTKETFDSGISDFANGWLALTTDQDTPDEQRVGVEFVGKLEQSVTRAVQRFSSRNEMIDVALLGELIATAGKASESKTSHGFDAMEEALSLMELGEF